MKAKLFFISAIVMNNLVAQTEFINFSPDRLFGDEFPTRTIDLNGDGVNDFRFHYLVDDLETFIYLETLGENEVLCHNPHVDILDHVINNSIVSSNIYPAPLNPILCQVNAELTENTILIESDTTYWSSSNNENKNALIFYNIDGEITFNFATSSDACYDYYFCRIKEAGTENYVYGYIQTFGNFGPGEGGFMHIGGTGFNPTVNESAVIDPTCDVLTAFEDGEQVAENEENVGINQASLKEPITVRFFDKKLQILDGSLDNLSELQLTIYSVSGDAVLNYENIVSSGNLIISLEHLNSGVYFVAVSENSYQKIIKIVL